MKSFARRAHGAALIVVLFLAGGCGDGLPTAPSESGTSTSAGPWIGEWTQVNFLSVDDRGTWGADDPSGIGFVQTITASSWTLVDELGRGCAVSFSYTVSADRRFSRRFTGAAGPCPGGVDAFNDSGRFDFSDGDRTMIEVYDQRPGDDIVAFRWSRRTDGGGPPTDIDVRFDADAPCSGFDDSVLPRTVMVPLNGTNAALVTIVPPAAASQVALSPPGLVSPIRPGASQRIVLQGRSAGRQIVEARRDDGRLLRGLVVDVWPRRDLTLSIHAVTDPTHGIAPTGVPRADLVESVLNRLWGLQANIHFRVTRADLTVRYDANNDGTLDAGSRARYPSAEMGRIIGAAGSSSSAYQMFYVNRITDAASRGDLGGRAEAGDRYGFVASSYIEAQTAGRVPLVTAHEMGHMLGINYESTDRLDLMYGAPTGCRITARDWNCVQQSYLGSNSCR